MAKITEGYMPFHGYQTYYRIVGEQKDNGKAPLICLHGGPPCVRKKLPMAGSGDSTSGLEQKHISVV